MISPVSLEDRIADHHRRKGLTLLLVVFVLVIVVVALSFSSVAVSIRPASAERPTPRTAAARLTARLALTDTADLSVAIDERKELLTHAVTVTFHADSTESTVASLPISLAEHPAWIVFDKGSDGRMHAMVSVERIAEDLQSPSVPGLPEAQSCEVLSTQKDERGVIRAQTSCIARAGYTIDPRRTADAVRMALETSATGSVAVAVTSVPAFIRNADGAPNDVLTLLATGHSNFKGSGDGRKSNVRKALNERMHNVLVPAGEVFSYNDALGNAGSLADGWKMALTIFEGVNLRPAPGGGVCQVSTTIFRAALRAGLPIVEQKNHSLYVSYYEAYGVGQDATVFPGKQDFRFRNDTGHPILLQSYNEGDEAYVNIYGIDDRRTVTVKGPYFAATTPDEVKAQDKKIRGNEIGWIRSVQNADGTSSDDVFIARYNAIPKSLPKKYSATVEYTRAGAGMANILHAAAGSGVVMR